MRFEDLSQMASYLSKDYASEFFKLLQIYPALSASEAAARLSLHIKTAQDFLEGLEKAGILGRNEVYERKRPYFRYFLKQKKIKINCDLKELVGSDDKEALKNKKINEKKNGPAHFTSSAKSQILSSVTLITGQGRNKKERKINLTENQGRFLFFLPFPTEPPKAISSLMKKAGVSEESFNEVLDIIGVLRDHKVINVV